VIVHLLLFSIKSLCYYFLFILDNKTIRYQRSDFIYFSSSTPNNIKPYKSITYTHKDLPIQYCKNRIGNGLNSIEGCQYSIARHRRDKVRKVSTAAR